MRIAFSGSHRVGKSTLVEQVADALPDHETVDEPYHLLEEDGYEVAESPSIEDFEAQLERSLEALEEGAEDVLFDRCPADILGYLLTHEDAESFDADDWLDRIRDSMQTLDLVVFVPVEEDDRVALPAHEDREWRLAVHQRLEELIVERGLGLDTEVLVVEGDVRSRVQQVLGRVEELAVSKRSRKKVRRRRE